MGELRFDMGGMGTRSKGMSAAIVVLGIAFFLLDFVVLKGEHVASDSVSFSSAEPAVLQIDRVGEEHLVEVDTRVRRRGETRGRAVKLTLMDPEGRILHEESEIRSRKERFFEFTPSAAGEYLVYVEDNGLLGGSSRGSARVAAFVNDRRIFARLFAF